MLVEIHMLQNHSPSNLNRDDTGSPKEAVFGGYRRARISSQCLKRSIRRSDIFQEEMEGHLANRTRRLPELVRKRLLEEGIAEDMAEIAAKKASGFGTSGGTEREAENNAYETAQTMFLTEADINAVVEVMKQAIDESKSAKEFEKVKAGDLQKKAQPQGFRPISVDVALFGRMTTSEALRDCEASAQVAHAISTHKVEHEYDFFTAVDDLMGTSEEEEDAGADMIGDIEYNSACYYKYASIDLDGLIANLTGESFGRKDIPDQDRAQARELAANAIDAFIRSAVYTTPSGKQNTFAAHQLPAAVFVEVRQKKTPVNYANAFVEPARQNNNSDLVSNSLEKFTKHVSTITKGFNLEADARFLLAPEHEGISFDGVKVERVDSINSLCNSLKGVILNG